MRPRVGQVWRSRRTGELVTLVEVWFATREGEDVSRVVMHFARGGAWEMRLGEFEEAFEPVCSRGER